MNNLFYYATRNKLASTSSDLHARLHSHKACVTFAQAFCYARGEDIFYMMLLADARSKERGVCLRQKEHPARLSSISILLISPFKRI
jgi:hypothetical protein